MIPKIDYPRDLGEISASDDTIMLFENNSFHFISSYEPIIRGEKWLIVGRRGTGKTALSEYLTVDGGDIILKEDKNALHAKQIEIININDATLFTDQFSEVGEELSKYEYSLSWFGFIFKMILKNQKIKDLLPSKLRNRLIDEGILEETSKLRKFKNYFKYAKYTFKSAAIQGMKTEERQASHINIQKIYEELCEILNEQEIHVKVILDELDYLEEHGYQNLLNSLVDKVYNLYKFRKNISFIVFLRADAFSLLTGTDLTKYRRYAEFLVWTEEDLLKMITKRLQILYPDKKETIFEKVIPVLRENTGDGVYSNVQAWSYLIQRTFNRPRDLNNFVIEVLDSANKTNYNKNRVLYYRDVYKRAEKSHSTGFTEDLIIEYKELFNVEFGSIKAFENILTVFHKVQASNISSDIINVFANDLSEILNIRSISPSQLTEKFFNIGIFGNKKKKRKGDLTHEGFKYYDQELIFNPTEQVVVHWSLRTRLKVGK